MSKGTYQFHHPYDKVNRHSDTSWKSFTCALLIFATLCFLLFFLAWPWNFKNQQEKENHYKNNPEKNQAEYIDKNTLQIDHTNKKNSPIIEHKNDKYNYNIRNYSILTPNEKLSSNEKDNIIADSVENKYDESSSISHDVNEIASTINYDITSSKDKNSNGISLSEITTEQSSYQNKTDLPLIDLIDCQTNPMDCILLECKNADTKVVESTNQNVKPCKNMYVHSCSGVTENLMSDELKTQKTLERIYGQLQSINESSNLYKKRFKEYYDICLNYNVSRDCTEDVRTTIKEIGKFSNIKSLSIELTELILRDFPIFFDIRVEIMKDTKKFGIVISPVPLITSNYEQILDDNLNQVLDDTNSENLDLNEIHGKSSESTNLEDIFLNETRIFLEVLASIENDEINTIITTLKQDFFLNTNKLNQNQNSSKSMTFGELKTTLINENIDWNKIMKKLINRDFNDDEYVQVYNIEYLIDVFNNIFNVDQGCLKNAILAVYVHHLFVTFRLKENRVKNRTSFCLKQALDMMPDFGSAIYLDTFEQKEIENVTSRVHSIFRKIQAAKQTQGGLNILTIENYTSCNDENIFTERLNFIGTFKNNSHYVENTVKLQFVKRKNDYKKLEIDPFNCSCMWILSSNLYDNQIKSIPDLEVIIVPLAASMNSNLPDYVTMADLGFKMAKEIEYLNIRTHETQEEQWKNVELSINDNIHPDKNLKLKFQTDNAYLQSDLRGANIAFQIYKDSQEQLNSCNYNKVFFANLIQNMCTTKSLMYSFHTFEKVFKVHPMIRANTLVGNLPEFSNDFKCENTLMEGNIVLT